ncbi:MAG: exo-alpha-sialidase [Verrucomicrobiaceae bacterium]|nr:MAG: exo-alpha-sialidase [Verrucomicrobiaceae bacterium]
MAAGEECRLERWAVLLGPENVTAGQRPLDAPASVPAAIPAKPDFSPGPGYSDSVRMFQGIPGIERAANGRLWATWYGGGVTEDKNNYILLHTSGDDGKSWQRVLVLDPDGTGPVRPFDPCLWIDPDGKLWLFWAQEIAGNKGRVSQTFAITTTDPGSATAKWSEPRLIGKGVMMNKPIVTADGRWLLPLSTWFADASSRAVVSSDHGATFADLGAARIPDAKDRNADEHMIVERKDGTLWMLVRTNYGIGESVSSDDGKTWSNVAPGSISHPVARFFIRKLASGRLLLVRHDPPNNGKSRSHLTAFLSDDDGRTWKGGLLLDERNGVSYPDGVQAPDGSIYIIYDYQRQRDKQILMAVFNEADVIAGKFASPGSRQRVLINQASGINPTVPAGADQSNRNSNAEGAALLAGPGAVLECGDVEEDSLEPGKTLFLDRAHAVAEVPEPLRGLKFQRGKIDGVHAVCRQAGVVYVMTPSEGRNPDSRETKLLGQDFQKVNLPEFPLFGGDPNLCSVFQKQMQVDEALDLGKWGVIVLP